MQTAYEIRQNLLDAGCSEVDTEIILEYIRSGNLKEAKRLIARGRKRQVDRMHESQRCIDRLDYLLFQLEGKAKHKEE